MSEYVSFQHALWPDIQDSLEYGALKNSLGPFKTKGRVVHLRHLSCCNYDACLGYAVMSNWPSFSCQGCRKTVGKVVKDNT